MVRNRNTLQCLFSKLEIQGDKLFSFYRVRTLMGSLVYRGYGGRWEVFSVLSFKFSVCVCSNNKIFVLEGKGWN